MTEEQREKHRAYMREYMRAKRATMTEREREERRAYARMWYRHKCDERRAQQGGEQ